ncbi:endopeptidase La [Haliangium ochraceum]|uniref:Lon protease n=1 Tax=Haliangium ochraceum (strain DSM 14365 / JCM 11303 / SMP-2) TaxID=502025 RepID=D0LIP5_HALO1|nr:endopeptidase La [Haliangium ochraceum]ACY18401.1 ATP-dependent protease La [Haliangium ochraceum DSM 14365]
MSTQFLSNEQYPVLATRSLVILPGVETPVDVGRKASVQAVEAAQQEGVKLLVVPQRKSETLTPRPSDLHEVGVLAEIVQVAKQESNRYTVMVRAQERLRITGFASTHPYLIADTEPFEVEEDDEVERAEMIIALRESLANVATSSPEASERTRVKILSLGDVDELVGVAADYVELEREDRLALLLAANPTDRLRRLLPIVARLNQVLTIKAGIDAELEGDISRSAREKVLRERMRAIREELGEADSDADLDEYRERIEASKMPTEVRSAARRQLGRMNHMSSSSPEYNVTRTYLETLLDLPWGIQTEDTLDVAAARAILDADHAGLEKVKKRILEFVAVRKLAPDKQGPILCLVGPPGVGKTSLGRSVATALGRKYVRTALGGVRDEAEIRGHRRTYIGALPGRIAGALKKAGAMNPVMVLDELDKLGSDHRGDPSSALLEVLDPEQNSTFSDHYLEIDLDLSRVMFIATANQTETIPAPLLDRLEIIRIPGYTLEEKRVIARKHLLPKQIAEHGLGRDQLRVDDEALDELIGSYTREAGVRNLEREIAAVCRHAAVEVASASVSELSVDKSMLEDVLGPPNFFAEMANRKAEVGVCAGLAWTPTGGQIQFVEARAMPGRGGLKLTGQVGDVMTESASTALSWVRANAGTLGIDAKLLQNADIHLHLPSGAVRKDGPSAGVAIVTALMSLFTHKPVRSDLAITGEVTLRGLVLPVGGIKEKVLAAHRGGIHTVFLPERNRKDLEDIPEEVRDALDIRFVKRADEVLALALADFEGNERGSVPSVLEMLASRGEEAAGEQLTPS